MGIIKFFVDIALGILCIGIGCVLFSAILSKGTGAFKSIVETIGLFCQAICAIIKKKLIKVLRKEAGIKNNEPVTAETEDGKAVEATVE